MAETGSSSIEQRAAAAEDEARAIAEAQRKGRIKGARLKVAEMAMRNALIVQRVAENWTWPMIAEESGISVRQCQRAYEDFKNQPSPLDVAPTELVEELARGYRITIGQFTALAARAEIDDNNANAAVGALKGANDAREKLLAILQAIGHVPHDLGVLKLQRDVQQVASRMLDTIEAFERGEVEAHEVGDTFREMAGLPVRGELMPGDFGAE